MANKEVKLRIVERTDEDVFILDSELDFNNWMEDGSIEEGDVVYEIYDFVARNVIKKLELE